MIIFYVWYSDNEERTISSGQVCESHLFQFTYPHGKHFVLYKGVSRWNVPSSPGCDQFEAPRMECCWLLYRYYQYKFWEVSKATSRTYIGHQVLTIVETTVAKRTVQIEGEARNSDYYQSYERTEAATQLQRDLRNAIGAFSWGTVLECFMVARCVCS